MRAWNKLGHDKLAHKFVSISVAVGVWWKNQWCMILPCDGVKPCSIIPFVQILSTQASSVFNHLIVLPESVAIGPGIIFQSDWMKRNARLISLRLEKRERKISSCLTSVVTMPNRTMYAYCQLVFVTSLIL
jgi:hypothetical protein